MKIHINLFITQFVMTQFLIQHGSKMDPKNCIDYRKMTIYGYFFYIIYTFLFEYNMFF